MGDGASPGRRSTVRLTTPSRLRRARSAAAEAVEHLLDGRRHRLGLGLDRRGGAGRRDPVRLRIHRAPAGSPTMWTAARRCALAITGSRSSTTRHWPMTSATAFLYSSGVAVAGSSALSASTLACMRGQARTDDRLGPLLCARRRAACALAGGLEQPRPASRRGPECEEPPARAGGPAGGSHPALLRSDAWQYSRRPGLGIARTG